MNKNTAYIAVALCSFGLLVLLAACHSLRLDDDSYAHFSVSVDTMAGGNWRAFVTDTWNKPVTAVAYGFAGQMGLLPARLVSVILSLATTFFVYRVAVTTLSCKDAMHPLAAVAFFLCQVSVFTQAFLTMTELLAAFFLALGLWCLSKRRTACAFLAIGMMPLARIETCLLAGWAFLVIWIDQLKTGGMTGRNVIRLLAYGILGMLPFSCWWVGGWLFSRDPLWMSADYVYLRSFDVKGMLSVNAVTGLPAALSAPLLVLFILGLLGLPAVMRERENSAAKTPITPILYGIVLIFLVFLSLIVVYPRGSGFGDIAVGVINPRSYSSIAPVIALFVFAGVLFLFRGEPLPSGRRDRTLVWAGFLLAQVSIAGFFFFNRQFGHSMALGIARLVQQSCLLLGFVLLAGILCLKLRKPSPPAGFARIAATYVAVYSIVCLPLTDPIFWYPLRFNDRKMTAQNEFGQWFKNNVTNSDVLVVQDMNGRLDRFCGIENGRFVWMYPALFQGTLQKACTGSLVLVETDLSGNPRDRYPAALINELESAQYRVCASSSRPRPLEPWEKLIQRITSRNDPVGWLVYEKIR